MEVLDGARGQKHGEAIAKKLSLSIVVPVYNSEKSLPQLAARLAQVLPEIADRYELILVNDGSRDDSWTVVQKLSTQYDWARGINLMRNYGQHNALLCGIRAARFEIVVTMDDDLQHPPEEIPHLLRELESGFDVVYGAPQTQNHSFLRTLASEATKIVLQNAMGADVARRISAFRAFRTHLRRAFADYGGSFVSVDVLLTWGTSRFKAVFVEHNRRAVGETNYTLRKLVAHAINMITGFSVLPLQAASVVGFAFTIFGIAILIYVVGRYVWDGGSSVPGFPFLAAMIAIFSGVQLFSLGVIGEYLARMYARSMNRPTYQILESLGATNDASETVAPQTEASAAAKSAR